MSDPAEQAAFERILEHLQHSRGFDFSAYKRASLMRRVLHRMDAVGVNRFDAYLDYLQVHPDEFPPLFNTILINVTTFFRDPEVWDTLRATVLPALLEARPGNTPIRVWSAGAASGQEAYSAAMLLAEHLGAGAFRDRVKIYATDVDEQALAEARQATYTDRQIAEVPEPLRAKYFDPAGDRFTFKREFRHAVIFGGHDLIQDAPISRVDLLLCRNALMYFNAEAQARIMGRFHFSVNPGGYLVLGRAEMLFTQTPLFQAIDLKRRIFKSTQTLSPRERHLLLVSARGGASVMPQPRPDDVGYRDIDFAPLLDDDTSLVGTRITFTEVTPLKALQEALAQSKQELETAYEELQSTNEELETANEELQSTIEELETTNEELQSTNEELQTMNDELRNRGVELNASNAYLESILTSLRSAVVVLDRQLRIQVWNAGATDLWGLGADEAEGQYFFSIEIGLPVAQFSAPVGEVLNGRAAEGPRLVTATNRKGRALQCRVSVSPLLGVDRAVTGVILVMDEQPAVV